jgi:hypothetical protein
MHVCVIPSSFPSTRVPFSHITEIILLIFHKLPLLLEPRGAQELTVKRSKAQRSTTCSSGTGEYTFVLPMYDTVMA